MQITQSFEALTTQSYARVYGWLTNRLHEFVLTRTTLTTTPTTFELFPQHLYFPGLNRVLSFSVVWNVDSIKADIGFFIVDKTDQQILCWGKLKFGPDYPSPSLAKTRLAINRLSTGTRSPAHLPRWYLDLTTRFWQPLNQIYNESLSLNIKETLYQRTARVLFLGLGRERVRLFAHPLAWKMD